MANLCFSILVVISEAKLLVVLGFDTWFFPFSVVESPIKQDELKSPRRFKIEEVNLVEYWRLVRKFLFKKLGYKKLNGPVACSIFQIHDKYVKSLTTPRPPTVAKPRDDAAFLVLNKPRATFDTRAFYKRYPSCIEQVKAIREKIDIRISTPSFW